MFVGISNKKQTKKERVFIHSLMNILFHEQYLF